MPAVHGTAIGGRPGRRLCQRCHQLMQRRQLLLWRRRMLLCRGRRRRRRQCHKASVAAVRARLPHTQGPGTPECVSASLAAAKAVRGTAMSGAIHGGGRLAAWFMPPLSTVAATAAAC